MSFLSPYRSIAQFVNHSDPNPHQPLCLLNHKSLISLSSKQFNIYSLPSLQLKLSGPKMSSKIRSISTLNEDIFISQKNKILRLRYWTIIKQYSTLHQSNVKGILLFDDLMLSWDYSNLLLVTQIDKNIARNNYCSQQSQHDGQLVSQIQLDSDILQILHPSTLLNKVLISTADSLQLYNLNSAQKIYRFKMVDQQISNEQVDICQICLSPVFHVIAISYSNNLVQLLDIMSDKIVDQFKVDETQPIKQLMFTTIDQPILIIAGSFGLLVYDLNRRRIVERVEQSQQQGIEYVGQTSDGFIYTANGGTNNISQWAIQQDQSIVQGLDCQYQQRFERVRLLQGIQGNINKLRFFDTKGFELIVSSDHSQCSLRNILINNQCFYQNYSLATKQQKKNRQKMKDLYDHDTTIKQVHDFQFSQTNKFNRVLVQIKNSKDYQLFDSENKRIIQQKLNIKGYDDTGELESIYSRQQQVSRLWMSNCGNYGLIGYDKGLLIKTNVQSNRVQNYCDRSASIDLLVVDILNKYVIIGQNKTLNRLDFLTFKQNGILELDQQINNYNLNHFNNLLALSIAKGTIYITNLNNNQKLEHCRELRWHTQPVTDLCFHSQYLYSCSLDHSLVVWDIISGSRLHIIRFRNKQPLRSIDVSFDGQLLAGVFMDSNQVCLWHNRCTQQQYSSKTIDVDGFVNVIEQDQLDGRVYQIQVNNQKQQVELQNQKAKSIIVGSDIKQYLDIDIKKYRDDENLIQLSSQEINKWLPLVDLDSIKQQSKVEITEQIETKIPFFLDFDNKTSIKQQYQEEVDQFKQNKSKIVNQEKKKYMDELNNDLDKFIELNHGDAQQVFEFLKTLTPSEIDYQFRQHCFNDPIKLLNLFSVWFESNDEFDLKSTYFNCLLKVSYDALINSKEAKQILKEIKYKEKAIREKLQRHMMKGLALLEKFTQIKG